jgi:hypothetical protein
MSPRCPECSRPMRLVSVLCSRALEAYPPVRTFECAACEKDMIWQGQSTPPDHNHTGQSHHIGATPARNASAAPKDGDAGLLLPRRHRFAVPRSGRPRRRLVLGTRQPANCHAGLTTS